MKNVIDVLNEEISNVLLSAINRQQLTSVFILDAPDHSNVGDQAILLGEINFLRKSFPGIHIGTASDRTYSNNLDGSIRDSDILFIQGGGNFGDLWLRNHNFRLMILEKFKEKKIIQFPQSINFTKNDILDKTQSIISNCDDFTFLIRDAESLAFARDKFDCKLQLCPDMAFSIGEIKSGIAKRDFTCLLRTDKERLESKTDQIKHYLDHMNRSYYVSDWINYPHSIQFMHNTMLKLSSIPSIAQFIANNGINIFELYAKSRLKHGVKLLCRGEKVITDRLHGLIISTLLRRPNYVFDSLDGKVKSYHNTWLSEDSNSILLNNFEDLEKRLEAE